MPSRLPDNLKIDKAFKGSQHVIGTDPDKSVAEENIFFKPYVTCDDVFSTPIPYNDANGAITSGVVVNEIVAMNLDPTVGGGYRAFDSPVNNVIHPTRHGEDYAPIFYHSATVDVSGNVDLTNAVEIPEGDLYANAAFDYREGYLVIARNAITDQWQETIALDEYYYTGDFCGTGTGGGLGDTTKEYVDQQDQILSGLITQMSGVSGVAESVLETLGTITSEPTGFENQTDSTISFDDGTMTFNIAPVGASYTYYIEGTKYEKTSGDNAVITDTEGMWYFYFDGEILTTTQTFNLDYLYSKGYISYIYWDATNKKCVTMGDERHGFVMDWATHIHLHLTFGTLFYNGLALGNITSNGNGNDDSHVQFSVENGTIADEDIILNIVDGSPQVLDGGSGVAQIPILYKSGTVGDWRIKEADNFPIIYSGDGTGYTGVNGRLPYNKWTGSTWQLAEITNNDFLVMLYFATNDINRPIIGVQGQESYTTLGNARTGAETELYSLSTAGMPFMEFTPIGGVIFQTSTGDTNAVKGRVRTTDDGDDYIDLRFTKGISTGSPTDHGNLVGLQDDDHLIYRHTDGRRDVKEFTVGCNNTGLTIPAYKFVMASGDCSINDTPGIATVNAITDTPMGITQTTVIDTAVAILLKRGRISIPTLNTSGYINNDISFDTNGDVILGSSPAIGKVLDNNGIVYVNIGGSGGSSATGGEVSFAQLEQTSGEIISYVDVADGNLQSQIDLLEAGSGGVSFTQLVLTSGDIVAQIGGGDVNEDFVKRYTFMMMS